MMRLVTQFDDPSMRPVAATPSCCACCSCCCSCCIVSVITTTSYVEHDLQRAVKRGEVSGNRVEVATCLIVAAIILGFIPAALMFLFYQDHETDLVSASNPSFVAFLALLVVFAAYRLARHRRPIVSSLTVTALGILAITVEMAAGVFLTLTVVGIFLYPFIAMALAAGGVRLAHELTKD